MPKNKSPLLLSLFLSGGLFLSGCSTYNEGFDCPPCRGVGCESITSVNKRVDDKRLEALQDPLHHGEGTMHRFWMDAHVDSDGSCYGESLEGIRV